MMNSNSYEFNQLIQCSSHLKLGDCAELIRKNVNPTENPTAYYIGLEHIEQNSLTLNGYGFARDINSQKNVFMKGDILFGKLRPYFRKIIIAPFDGICSTDIWVIRPKGTIDRNFLFYWMASDDFVDAVTNASEGTRMPRAKWEYASALMFPSISAVAQKNTGWILRTLDERIQLLLETNVTLESIAQALFKSWFIDFDPVHAKAEGCEPEGIDAETASLFPDSFDESRLGKIPMGWSVVSFLDTIHVIGGGTPKTSIPEYWNGDIPWFSVVDAPTKTDVFVIDTEKHITASAIKNSSTKLLSEGTTIISARGTVGRLALVGKAMAMNQSCYGLVGKAGDSFFTFYSTNHLVELLKQNGHGSVFNTITRDTFASISVVYPKKEIINKFEAVLCPIMERIKKNNEQVSVLSDLRDGLLPKLISGQICLLSERDKAFL